MKRLLLITVVLLSGISRLFASGIDPDSLKQQLAVTADSLKGPVYTQLANQYLNYDTIKDKQKKLEYQNQALDYTMQALHFYSRYNDSIGQRNCFDALTKIYHSQKKYSQAKWFILQSNTISRSANDTTNIIKSLLELASIKVDIKNYDLAMRDLNEALHITVAKHWPQNQSEVELSYASLYKHMNNYAKADIAMRRHNFIDDSIRRAAHDSLIAKLRANDSIQVKKKVYTASNRRISRTYNSRRIASL